MMSEAIQRSNVKLLDYAIQLQQEHARQDPALRTVLRSSSDAIGTNGFATRLQRAVNRSTLPIRVRDTQPATVPEVPSSLQASTTSSPQSIHTTRSSVGASSISHSYHEISEDEEPTVREPPTNGVPTALFRDDDRRPPPPTKRPRTAAQDGPQHIIVDRNDGTGVKEEFRRPRPDLPPSRAGSSKPK